MTSLALTLTVRAGGVVIHAATATAQPADFEAANDRVEGTVEVAPDSGGCRILGTGAMTARRNNESRRHLRARRQRQDGRSGGSDELLGGPGDDRITGGPAPTPLVGGDGSHRILGGTVTT